MGESDVPETVTVTREGPDLPVAEVLTGRGFVTGKSGSGKSNTAGVVAEELLDAGLPMLVVDTDGEYYGLKEEFELLHVGGDDTCDARVDAGHAGKLAELALSGVPVVLDVSAFPEEAGRDLVAAVVRELFAREKRARQPFLLVVEEVHEYLPEGRGLDDAGETLLRVAKRGRKRGLGLLGISQRPAAVDKDFVTQCDWLVWHRLTWENDTRVVSTLLGEDAAATVGELDDGEALLVTDWDDAVRRVRFRRKRTFDAGATPDLGAVDRPDLRSVDGDLVAELRAAGTGDDGERVDPDGPTDATGPDADVADLRAELERKDERIAELEARLAALEGGPAGGGEQPTAGSEATGDPFWEFGRLVAHLVRTAGRGVAGIARRLGPTGRRESAADADQ